MMCPPTYLSNHKCMKYYFNTWMDFKQVYKGNKVKDDMNYFPYYEIMTFFSEKSCKSKVDLCFIIDSSDTINYTNPPDGSYDNWNFMIQFVVSLARTYSIGPDAAQISVVQFAENSSVIFPLNAHDNQDEIVQVLQHMEIMNDPRNTALAMNKAREECFSPESGDRQDVPNLAVLITHGAPASPEASIDAARALRDSGVTVVAVGITIDVEKKFLSKMSSPPQVFSKSSVRTLFTCGLC